MASRNAQSLALERARSKAQALRREGKTAAQIAKALGRSKSWVYHNTKSSARSANLPAPTAPLGSTPGGSVGSSGDSVLRYDIRPEDVLDQETLDEINRKHAASDAEFQRRLENGTLEEGLLTVDDLRELIERASRGEQVTLKKN